MTMTYSWEKKYNPWDIEPDVFDELEDETENAKIADEISLDELADEEFELSDEEFDL